MEPAMSPASPDLIEVGRNLWATYDIRVIVILSLLLEATCLILGPFRKRTTSGLITGSLWFAYLFSSVISSYGLGLMRESSKSGTDPGMYIHSLWASILFIHLGGPDTVTAFSLQDNALWLRKYLSFFTIIYFTIGIIAESPSGQHYKKIPAFLLFLSGQIRYLSWISSLLFSSMEPTEIKDPREPWVISVNESEGGDYSGELTNLQVLEHAYTFFTTYEGLAVGFRFNFQSCRKSRELFLKLTPKDAFRVVERELNFFYEVLYTKAWVVHDLSMYIIRFVESGLILVALVLFYKEEKGDVEAQDRVITYVLLLGSVIIDVYTMLMVLTADWFVERYSLPKPLKRGAKLVRRAAENLTSSKNLWSNALYQYNLIERTLKMSKSRIFKECCLTTNALMFGIPGYRLLEMFSKIIEKLRHVTMVRFDEVQGIKDFIVQQLIIQSSLADINPSTSKEFQSAKGAWILSQYEIYSYLLHWINDVDFGKCILNWHIATEICFHTDDDERDGIDGNLNKEKKDLSKHLSDYMLYLLVANPQMMSTVAEGDNISKLPRDQLKILLSVKNLKMEKSNKSSVMKEACAELLSLFDDMAVDEYESKLIWIGGSRLAKDLKRLGDRKWEVLSKVWFEMLCYAASHCQASAHMEQLKQGGQVLTIVWLLMVHFGLVN